MADITIDDLTTGTIGGTGVFDKLLAAVKVHVQQEFSEGRIRGSDYATVYLGALQSVISQSLQFLLQEQISDKQADLLAAQIVTQGKQSDLLDTEIIKSTSEANLIDTQVLKVTSEINLIDQKKKTEEAQILDTIDGSPVAGAIGKQIALYEAQTSGFNRDAEQKAAQIFSNLASVIYSTDPDAISPLNAGFGEDNIKSLLVALAGGVGVTIT